MQSIKLTSLAMALSLALSGCGGSDSEPEIADRDGDGIEDTLDVFPDNASEWQDSDADGVGDNSDAFPQDASETLDTDSDGVGDNADAFPTDETEQSDSDDDGVGDNADVFPQDATETIDTDEDGVGDNADAFPFDPNRQVSLCTAEGTDVNFDALLGEDCKNLSDYNLFNLASNPTTNVNGSKSLKYDLSTPLFTDYATKYRFVVMPDQSSAQYVENEVLDMPVGTVLIKTFSLPSDTSVRGFANETLIETRLLIHRENGWLALPYKWNEEGTDAELVKSGRAFTTEITHNGELTEFKYVIPSTADCKECHQLLDTDESGNAIAGSGKFSPIGPKARLMNYSLSFDDTEKNQLTAWADKEMLTGLPEDLSAINNVLEFHDDDIEDVTSGVLSVETVNQLARGYLDINCAHCHRPEGSANNYGLFLEYARELGTQTGVCKSPIAPPGNSSLGDDLKAIIPGNGEGSFMYERISSTDGGLKMPKIGRSLVHTEGTELIKYWIDLLDEDPFNLSCAN